MDAVCINQKDEKEKPRQVDLMRAIYTTASIVSVCLQTSRGPEGVTSLLHEVTEAFHATDVVYELAYLDLKTFSSEGEVYHQFHESIRNPRWLAFQALVRNPWFTRIWVVQEVALASSIRVFYGRSEFSWELLVAAITTCVHHPALASFLDVTGEEKDSLTRLIPPQSPINLGIMADFQQRFKDNKISFTSAIYESNRFCATNPKDHVFGLLGFYRGQRNTENLGDINKPGNKNRVRKVYNHVAQHFTRIFTGRPGAEELDAGKIGIPDKIKTAYTKSVTKVYKDVAQYLLEQDHPLRLLSYAGIGFFTLKLRQPGDEKKNPDTKKLPSWCPNWSQQPLVRILSYTNSGPQNDHYSAGGSTGKRPKCSSEDDFASLIIRGRVLDTIVALGQTLTPPSASGATTTDKAFKTPFTNSTSSTPEAPSTYKVDEVITCFKAASESLDLLESTFGTRPYPYTTQYQSTREVFWRTLIGNRIPLEYPAPISCEVSFDLWVAFGTIISSLSGPLSRHAEMPLAAMQVLDVKETFGTLIPGCGLGRRMCVTEKGYVGMVPPLTLERDEKGGRKGDVVFLVRGAEVPFVLRPVEEEKRKMRYQLVGEAYIHGVMAGEMAEWDDEGFEEEEIEII
jgi:hypothetical protein